MGILSKLGALFLLLIIGIALLYLFDKPLFDSIIINLYKGFVVANVPITTTIPPTGLSSSKNSTLLKHQISFLSNETNAIASSSPIPIKQVAVFGTGTNITTLIPINAIYNFSLQKTSDLYVYSNGFYVPTYEVIEETYYKGNSSSIGDYIPSLIGQKVYLNFYVYVEKTNMSSPYIVKSENIQGNEIIWNITFDGNINNTINPNNITQLYHRVSWLNGIVLLNGTTLLSPRNPYIK